MAVVLLHCRAADRNAAWGIVLAIGISAIIGLMYVVALMFSIQVGAFPVALGTLCSKKQLSI